MFHSLLNSLETMLDLEEQLMVDKTLNTLERFIQEDGPGIVSEMENRIRLTYNKYVDELAKADKSENTDKTSREYMSLYITVETIRKFFRTTSLSVEGNRVKLISTRPFILGRLDLGTSLVPRLAPTAIITALVRHHARSWGMNLDK